MCADLAGALFRHRGASPGGFRRRTYDALVRASGAAPGDRVAAMRYDGSDQVPAAVAAAGFRDVTLARQRPLLFVVAATRP